MIARLPNIAVLNGGDPISPAEREEAERDFLRRWLEQPIELRPERVAELMKFHGELAPLAKIDLSPTVFVRVGVVMDQDKRELVISVRQRVRHFKARLQGMFKVPANKMRLWYYDKELVTDTGPLELKWPEKGLYTLNIRSGDYFVVEDKRCRRGSLDEHKEEIGADIRERRKDFDGCSDICTSLKTVHMVKA